MGMFCREGIHGVWVRGHVFDICVLVGVALWGNSCWDSLGWGAHGVRIGIHWGVGTISICGGSGWRASLDLVDPSFVHGPSPDEDGGHWGPGSGWGVGIWAGAAKAQA
ncbi:hypothetical protein ILYODFUR_016935 [Ilyodon furcidens]|uniref:Uncharacterized protein n=1 Tax=Ilyodon furcidens TaxID=33524 RepID=A0ABV0TAF5_9TELE